MVVDLQAMLVHDLVILVLKFDAMSVIHGAWSQDRQYLVDLIQSRLCNEDRSARINRKSKSCVVFLYVGVQEYICFVDGDDAFQSQLDWKA